MTEDEKAWIDGASIEDLLRKWRFAPAGDPIFSGETGQYFSARMNQLRNSDPAAWTRASKEIGWQKP